MTAGFCWASASSNTPTSIRRRAGSRGSEAPGSGLRACRPAPWPRRRSSASSSSAPAAWNLARSSSRRPSRTWPVRWTHPMSPVPRTSLRHGRRGRGRRRARPLLQRRCPLQAGPSSRTRRLPLPRNAKTARRAAESAPGEARRLPLPRRGRRDPVHREGQVAALARAQLLPGGHRLARDDRAAARSVLPISR